MIKRIDDENGYAAEVEVATPAVRLFDAISTVDGLNGWWMGEARGNTKVGDEFTVTWRSGANITARVEVATAPAVVRWRCIGKAPEIEWMGTEISFDITEHGTGSTLVFHHHGLRSDLDCWERCEGGWDFLLPKLCEYAASS